MQIPLKVGHHRHASETPFKRIWLAGNANVGCSRFVSFQGVQTSIAKEHFSFMIFQRGWGPDTLSPCLDPHMTCACMLAWRLLQTIKTQAP